MPVVSFGPSATIGVSQGMLRDAASGDQCVAVLWGDSGGAAGEVLKLDDLEVGFIKTIIATCDISKSGDFERTGQP